MRFSPLPHRHHYRVIDRPRCPDHQVDHLAGRRTGAALLALLLLFVAGATAVQARELTDMTGHVVTIPDPVTRPFGAAPPLTALLYALAPDLVSALNIPFAPGSGAYLRSGTTDLPVLGSAMGHGQRVNPEALLKIRPDLALAWQNAFSDLDRAGIEAPFRAIGVPVFYLKLDTLDDWPPAFMLAGRILGREARARKLADYIRDAQTRVAAAVSGIPEAKQVRVYYAEGPDGLATDCNTSFHTEVIALAGAYNVYRCSSKTMVGQERVSLEQVLLWAPQVLLVQDSQFAATVRQDPRWAQVPAVAADRVILIPRQPLNWIDRPPSFMRALGIRWLANALYPERLPLDLEAETRAFYRLFFGVEPTRAQFEALLTAAPARTAP